MKDRSIQLCSDIRQILCKRRFSLNVSLGQFTLRRASYTRQFFQMPSLTRKNGKYAFLIHASALFVCINNSRSTTVLFNFLLASHFVFRNVESMLESKLWCATTKFFWKILCFPIRYVRCIRVKCFCVWNNYWYIKWCGDIEPTVRAGINCGGNNDWFAADKPRCHCTEICF